MPLSSARLLIALLLAEQHRIEPASVPVRHPFPPTPERHFVHAAAALAAGRPKGALRGLRQSEHDRADPDQVAVHEALWLAALALDHNWTPDGAGLLHAGAARPCGGTAPADPLLSAWTALAVQRQRIEHLDPLTAVICVLGAEVIPGIRMARARLLSAPPPSRDPDAVRRPSRSWVSIGTPRPDARSIAAGEPDPRGPVPRSPVPRDPAAPPTAPARSVATHSVAAHSVSGPPSGPTPMAASSTVVAPPPGSRSAHGRSVPGDRHGWAGRPARPRATSGGAGSADLAGSVDAVLPTLPALAASVIPPWAITTPLMFGWVPPGGLARPDTPGRGLHRIAARGRARSGRRPRAGGRAATAARTSSPASTAPADTTVTTSGPVLLGDAPAARPAAFTADPGTAPASGQVRLVGSRGSDAVSSGATGTAEASGVAQTAGAAQAAGPARTAGPAGPASSLARSTDGAVVRQLVARAARTGSGSLSAPASNPLSEQAVDALAIADVFVARLAELPVRQAGAYGAILRADLLFRMGREAQAGRALDAVEAAGDADAATRAHTALVRGDWAGYPDGGAQTLGRRWDGTLLPTRRPADRGQAEVLWLRSLTAYGQIGSNAGRAAGLIRLAEAPTATGRPMLRRARIDEAARRAQTAGDDALTWTARVYRLVERARSGEASAAELRTMMTAIREWSRFDGSESYGRGLCRLLATATGVVGERSLL
ncbi:conserved hypothetical protein [Frankia sp. AiPs1]|uniref:hypothetical protein n=1 Tax=Frankia sp. AiPa1 TaxID=573492 RepID=UPI00202B7612|nr:hypothetical protein [Frankia sp. AiPa1]MCL9760859.1 hypothetical protein [Frankia sp. AiPa1]